MKKLLFVTNELSIGGVQRSLISLLNVLVDSGFDIDLMILKSGGELEKQVPRDVRVIPFPAEHRWLFLPKDNLVSSLKYCFGPNLNFPKLLFFLIKGIILNDMERARQQLFRSCRHTIADLPEKYDAAMDYPGIYKAYIIHKVQAKKKLSWVHGNYDLLGRDLIIDEEDYNDIDAVVNVSESCQEIFLKSHPSLLPKCYIVPNVTRKKEILELADDAGFGDTFNGTRILDVSRLDYGKGIEIAVDACRMLLDKGYIIRWYILGEGPERRKIEKKIAEKGVSNSFFLLGQKLNPYPYMREANLIVHCSRSEGKSVAIDEAMLLSKPIVLTNYATAKDQVESGVTGIICEMSPEGVGAAIENLLLDESLARKLSANLANFALDSAKTLEMFEHTIRGK